MNVFWAIILGITQGLTEFFPVSSSAHLAIFPWLFKFTDPGLSFDIALHAGTLIAIFLALWPDWKKLLTGLLKTEKSFEKKLVWFLVLTSVPGAIFGFFLENKAETVFRTPLLIALTLSAFGLILYWVDHRFQKNGKITGLDSKNAFFIGLVQAVAIIPGVSRSGATITAGKALGLSREEAVRYSFLAALPIIFGATVFGLRHIELSEFLSPIWFFGFLAAFVSSFWAIKAFLSFAARKNFNVFVIYRFLFAFIIIVTLIARK